MQKRVPTTAVITMQVESRPEHLALLHLLQLASPLLPVGAYAYSQGLEYAVTQGWVTNEAQTQKWLVGLLQHTLGRLDIPVLARLYQAWAAADQARVAAWNGQIFASRETAELQQEDRHLGTALARLLTDLGMPEAKPWRRANRVCFATLFSLAAVRWTISLEQTATAYLWAWAENQISAAIKLIPLGQTAGQRILSQAIPDMAAVVHHGLALNDDEIGCSVPGLTLASALHETQYSRLFRS
jgi:urease accessory protein